MQMSHRNSEQIYLVDIAFKKCAKINDNSNNRNLAPQTAIADGLHDLSAAAFLTRVLMTWRRLITPVALTSVRVSWRRPIMQMRERERAEGSMRLHRPEIYSPWLIYDTAAFWAHKSKFLNKSPPAAAARRICERRRAVINHVSLPAL